MVPTVAIVMSLRQNRVNRSRPRLVLAAADLCDCCAPAPLLGFGIPSALAIGGVLVGAKFLRRKR